MSAALPSPTRFGAAPPLRGVVRVPGDESISHRALMLSALAVGESRIEGLPESVDVLATAAAMRTLGADVVRDQDGTWRVHGVGVGGLLQPRTAVDVRGSETSARLLMGLLTSHPVTAAITGDAALSRQSMEDVIEPLSRMGADFTTSPGGRLPLMLRGACPAVPIEYRLPVASAGVKSAVLFAALNAPGIIRVIEPTPARDHSERMLRGFGADLVVEHVGGERIISLHGEAELRPQRIVVPGTPSLAALLVVAALIVPGSAVTIENVGLNPTRAGLFEVLRAMGADIRVTNQRDVAGEPVADLMACHSAMRGIEVPAEIAPSMIDEFPILFVAGAFAVGRTVTRGLHGLRSGHADRLAVMAEGLRAAGARVEEREDGLVVDGTGGDLLPGGATVATAPDHRLAMSFAVAGLRSRAPIGIDHMAPAAVGIPWLAEILTSLAGEKLRDEAA